MIDETTKLVKVQQGHTLFEINHAAKTIVVADVFADAARPALMRIIVKLGCEYVAALNMKNAIKHYNRQK